MLEKTEGAIKNEQFRDICNTGHTRHRMKTNKTNNPTQKTKKVTQTQPKKLIVNSDAHEG